jgi:hypothetical protein
VLFGARQKCHKLVRRRAQVANASIRRQRTDVQQNSGGTLKFHSALLHDGGIGVTQQKDAAFEITIGRVPEQSCTIATESLREPSFESRRPISPVCLSVWSFVSILAISPIARRGRCASAARNAGRRLAVAGRGQGSAIRRAGLVCRLRRGGWYIATVPGTVLTSLVNDHVYPEPLYGENERPEIIPESLVHTSYWYRTVVRIPIAYTNRHIWLNFDGINYSAEVWVNGAQVGTVRGAFIRGVFDITAQVKPGQSAVVAVLVTPKPNPGVPHEHTWRDGVGQNGGITAIDGPTFLSTLGWDWLNAVRDRDTGIWQKVFLSATGPVLVKDPLVTTDLPLPETDSSDITVQTTVENVTDQPVDGVVRGAIENIVFERQVTLPPHTAQQVTFDAKSTPALHMEHPRLWWPNGYGAQEMYKLHLEFKTAEFKVGEFRTGSAVSDAQDVEFGVRKISYSVPGADTLTISVNGVPIFIRGGDWGLDEAMKRIPRDGSTPRSGCTSWPTSI